MIICVVFKQRAQYCCQKCSSDHVYCMLWHAKRNAMLFVDAYSNCLPVNAVRWIVHFQRGS